MAQVIVISGAGSGFGALTARALADAGNIVYAGIRETTGRNAGRVRGAQTYAREHGVDLRTTELDVSSQASVDTAVARIVRDAGRLDVVIHNAGHMVNGPTEAFTPEQLAQVYDTNVLSTQRLNRAALPHLRGQGHGLVLWVGSSSTRGGTPPYLAPYFAAMAAMDALAVSYAAELARFGIETSIVVPGSFTSGTHHFASAGTPGQRRTRRSIRACWPPSRGGSRSWRHRTPTPRAIKQVQYRHQRALDIRLADIGTTLVQWDALRAIGRLPGASAHELAAETFQSDQAFGTLAGRLLAQGLIERRPGRRKRIEHHLTSAGTRVSEAGYPIAEEVLGGTLAPLTEAERATLLALLRRVVAEPASDAARAK
ncbi:SDR family NAD(P)-dependent oxidoreductase [Deinococcus aestuarii]|uniref:SDR family NAD(P)-dependent oxidoreductase n=1 Tax=Deinococcus aestuarii TaxID=2774531 RepID=UPI001C0B5136|nr:SDR family NAD(P)-dependent oxidoreductase [Deinococcus aestuarii]